MNWIILLFLFISFLGVFMAGIFFLRSKGDRMANILMGIYTLLFAFEMLNNCLRWSGDLNKASFIHLNLAHFPLWTIYGPLVFIYVRRVIASTGFKASDLFFLGPPLTLIAMLFPFYRLPTASKIEVVLEGRIYEYALFPSYTIWLVIALLFFYALLTFFTYWQHRGIGLRENKWLRWFVGAYFGFAFAFALYIFLVRFQIMDPKYDYFIDMAIVFFIGVLTFFGFVQPDVFEGKSIKDILPFIKYRKTGLSDALSLEMKEKLVRVMQQRKPYLNPELRLDDLALLMNLSRHHTSQIINEHFNLSFFDLINQYRVKDAKNLLLQNREEGVTITQIAYDVGFNNRASFYKAFKKFADASPSEYIKPMEAS